MHLTALYILSRDVYVLFFLIHIYVCMYVHYTYSYKFIYSVKEPVYTITR